MLMLIYLAVIFTESHFSVFHYSIPCISSESKLGSSTAGHDIASGLDVFFRGTKKIYTKKRNYGRLKW